MNKVIYIAGPYTADTRAEIFYNISVAVSFAARVRKHGFVAIVPHLESLYNEDALTEEQWLDHGYALLLRSDAVLDIRNGQRSLGTEKEIQLAILQNIPVFVSIEELVTWGE